MGRARREAEQRVLASRSRSGEGGAGSGETLPRLGGRGTVLGLSRDSPRQEGFPSVGGSSHSPCARAKRKKKKSEKRQRSATVRRGDTANESPAQLFLPSLPTLRR